MKHVSEKYEAQLSELAATLCTPERFGDLALQDTVEYPHGLKLAEPVEHGWVPKVIEGVGIPDRPTGPRAV